MFSSFLIPMFLTFNIVSAYDSSSSRSFPGLKTEFVSDLRYVVSLLIALMDG